MKPEDIKRIAEIIGLEPKCSEDGPFVCLVRDKDKHAVNFQPDTHWYSTGMLLEWVVKKGFEVRIEELSNDFNSVVFYDKDGNAISSDLDKSMQLAICNAVLSVGEEVK